MKRVLLAVVVLGLFCAAGIGCRASAEVGDTSGVIAPK